MALALKFPRTPIFTNVVLLTAPGCPVENPSPYCVTQGDLETKVHFRVVKLWELDAEVALQMRRTSKDEALAARFLTLGSLNPEYDQFRLLELLGRHGMLLKNEIVEQSDFIRYYQDKAKKRGLAQGRRDALLTLRNQLLAERFPGLQAPPALSQCSHAQLQGVLLCLYSADSRAAAQAALDTALTQ